jgi:hypothetical protein
MVGTASYFLGIYLTTRRTPVISFADFRAFCLRINLRKLLWIYFIVYFLVFLTGNFIWLFPGLTQPLYIVALFRWSIFFILFITVFFQNRFKGVFFILILIDVVSGFFSFFSTFKEVIYFSFIAYWIFFFRGRRTSQAIAIGFVFLTLLLGVYWTAVKRDYRSFLNKGTGGQIVLASREEAYAKLMELITEVKSEDLELSSDQLLNRLSWIKAFDAVYKWVPAKVPHEGGNLWWNAVKRPFLPRLLFPEKTGLADSKELNYYSNLHVDEKNTSISLSMMAGSYVDFGKNGMHAALFLFGLFCGWVYSKAIQWGGHVVMGYALTMPMIYLLHVNEESINRMFAAMVLYLLGIWFVRRFLLGIFLRAILVPEQSRPDRVQKLASAALD